MWDDSYSAGDLGGSCLSQEEAAERLQDPAADLQELVVDLSNDGHIDTWASVNTTEPLQIR